MSIKKCKKMAAFSAAISKIFLLDRSVGVEHRQGSQELDILALGSCALGQNGDAVYHGAASFPDHPSYYSLIIVKE